MVEQNVDRAPVYHADAVADEAGEQADGSE